MSSSIPVVGASSSAPPRVQKNSRNDLEGGTPNEEDNGVGAAASALNDLEIHKLDEEFEGLGDEVMEDVGLDQNVLNDLLN